MVRGKLPRATLYVSKTGSSFGQGSHDLVAVDASRLTFVPVRQFARMLLCLHEKDAGSPPIMQVPAMSQFGRATKTSFRATMSVSRGRSPPHGRALVARTADDCPERPCRGYVSNPPPLPPVPEAKRWPRAWVSRLVCRVAEFDNLPHLDRQIVQPGQTQIKNRVGATPTKRLNLSAGRALGMFRQLDHRRRIEDRLHPANGRSDRLRRVGVGIQVDLDLPEPFART